MSFAGARVLITGGLGFIGSNLAARLVREGARVTLCDAMIDGYGGNLENRMRFAVEVLSEIRRRVGIVGIGVSDP